MPRKAALELMLTGRVIDADEAQRLGVVSRVVSRGDLDRVVDEVVEALKSKSAAILMIGRDAFYGMADLDFDSALDRLQTGLTAVAMSEDAAEGIAAFLEKREPRLEVASGAGLPSAGEAMRRNVQILGWTLIWSGIFLFGYLGWQLYGTDVVNARVQTEAKTTLERRLAEGTAPEVEEVEEEGVVVEHVLEDVPGEGVGFATAAGPQGRAGGCRLRGCDQTDPCQRPGPHAGNAPSRATRKRGHFRASDHLRPTLP